jgi:hypothetical protein
MSRKEKRMYVSQEHGSPYLPQHVPVVVEETMAAGVTRARVKHECRLDWYAGRMLITDRQFDAGIRLRADWTISNAERRVTSTYGQAVVGAMDFTAAQLGARRRMVKALAAMTLDEARVALDVCAFDEWASGRLPTLRDALTSLADHYGLEKDA